MNYFEQKEDKATVLEYLSYVEEMIKEYLNKPAKSSRTPNNSEPSTTSNLAKPTSNPVPPVILQNLQVTTNLVHAPRRVIPSNTFQMI